MPQDAITKYLANYAEPEATVTLPGRQYQHCLVIPAFNEQAEDVERVWRAIQPGASFLVILVVNSHIEEDPSARGLVDSLTRHKNATQLNDQVLLAEDPGSGPDLLVIDRYSRGYQINKRQGVGLARKIGMDIALSLMSQGVIANRWLFTTDADTELPENYFDIEVTSTDAALIYTFRHRAGPGLELPTLLYETSMLYYVAGLLWANSPYAYPTIGSLISCSPDRYATVRGFPKRNTGEDFYLLNKLRKTGDVRLKGGDPVIIAGRLSARVPIGTGQAIKTIGELHAPAAEFTVEHPDCFMQLKRFLEWLGEISIEQPINLSAPDPDIDNYVQQIGLAAHYERKRRQSPAPRVMHKHLHDWFDALKTRQFIHHFRDHHFGTVTTGELGSAPFLHEAKGKKGNMAELDTINAGLRAFIYHQQPL